MHTYRVVIGDWSTDGHGRSDDYLVKTSHKQAECQQAYRDAVKASGVALDHQSKAKIQLCCDFEDSYISAEAIQKLTELGVVWDFLESELNDDGGVSVGPDEMARLFMEMIRTQIPDFQYRFVKEPPALNGWWGNLNVSIGYGCYNM